MATPTDSSPIPTLDLNDGRAIPQLGLGCYAMHGPEGVDAIANSAVDREKLFVTSKLPGRHHGFDESIASTEESLARLGLDYLDLHLIHWPIPSVGKYVETWRGLIELRERGLVKSIGV